MIDDHAHLHSIVVGSWNFCGVTPRESLVLSLPDADLSRVAHEDAAEDAFVWQEMMS